MRKQIPLAWRGRWTLYTVVSGDPTRFYAPISARGSLRVCRAVPVPRQSPGEAGVGVPITLEGQSELTREVRREPGCVWGGASR